MEETKSLAEHIARAEYRSLPAEVVSYARKTIGDTIACALGGRKTVEVETLIQIMNEFGGRQEATVIGDVTRLLFMHAAQVNRVAAHILDYDETMIKVGHMSSVLVPVALSVGEYVGASGKDVINAVVLGYEAVSRIRDAVQPSEDVFWNTFDWVDSGLHFGVAVVSGKLFRLTSAQMADALGLAGLVRARQITVPDLAVLGQPQWRKVTGGDVVIPGIHAVMLARKGFPGDRHIFDQGGEYVQFVGSDRYDPSRVASNLGKEYQMLGIGFKYYAACRHVSSTLDAVAQIVSDNDLTAENIEQVTVRVQKPVADKFAIYDPTHMIQAQFSIPYTVSMVLLGVPTGPQWYQAEMLGNPKARELQHRVKLEEDPEAKTKFYRENKVPSTVEIATRDGRRLEKHVEFPKGEPQNPFTEGDHTDKLTNMASWLGMTSGRIADIAETLQRVESLSTIDELTRLLVAQL